MWLDAHFVAATGLQPDDFDDRTDLELTRRAIVSDRDRDVDGMSTSERRAHSGSRHTVETSPASSASSAA